MALELQNCCEGLGSGKITERKKCAELLWTLMENKETLRMLNNNHDNLSLTHVSWDDVVASVHVLLNKEAQKLVDDERKRKNTATSTTIYTKQSYGDLLILVVRKANLKTRNLTVSKLIEYIIECFTSSALKMYFYKAYLTVLKDCVLSVTSYWGGIKTSEWLSLLYHLKKLHRNPLPGMEELKPLQCLELLFKWGPLHSLPCTKLRQEFSFITQIVHQINGSSARSLTETVLKLLLEFVYQTAEDNRVACCKLGEELFSNLIGIYQSQTHENIKVLILKFFLLQVQIHHPNGSCDGSNFAYACSWKDWHKHLRSVYSILCLEVNNNMQIKFKPPSFLNGQKSFDMLHETFASLIIEVFRQVYHHKTENNLDVTIDEGEPLSKRIKVEIGIPAIIRNIQESKDWPWINVITALLKKYPDLIEPNDFENLLRILSGQQSECKFSNIRYHLYECLVVLVEVEAQLDLSEHAKSINSLWPIIWECTLRAVGLNENEEQTHKLLKKLIFKRKTSNSVQLFRMYMSRVVNVSKFSVETLNFACSHFGLPESSGDERQTLINWILKVYKEKWSNIDVLSETIVSQGLIFLTFKQWPKMKLKQKQIEKCKVDLIEDVYSVTFFDSGLVLNQMNESRLNNESPDQIDYEILTNQCDTFEELTDTLCEFASIFLEPDAKHYTAIRNIVNVAVLLANVLSFAIHYNILTEDDLTNNKLTERVIRLINKGGELFLLLSKKLREKNFNNFIDVLRQFKLLFALNMHDAVSLIVRKNTKKEVVKELFDLLHPEEGDGREEDQMNRLEEQSQGTQLRLAALDVLCSYCWVSNVNYTFVTQQQAIEILAKPNFEAEVPADYEIAMGFLKSLNNYKPGTLTNDLLYDIIDSIQTICVKHYTNYKTASSILKIMYNLYSHIALSNDLDLQNKMVLLLYPFYDQRNKYGPKVSKLIVDCMGELVKVDPHMLWSKWQGGQEIASEIPQFLCSDFQQVRIAAIKNLQIIFNNSSFKDNSQLGSKNLIFDSLCAKCFEVFNVDGDLSDERRVDEVVTRTASALHTLACVMACNSILRQKALFVYLKLIHQKKLNLDSALRVLDMVANHLKFNDSLTLLEINLNYLISQWDTQKYPLKEFPFALLQCSTEMEFYVKYMQVVVPVLITNDQSLLVDVSKHNEKSVEEIVEKHFSNLVAKCLLITTVEQSHAVMTSEDQIEYKNRCFRSLVSILTSEKVDQLIMEKLSDIITDILQFCFDSEDIFNKFAIRCALPEPQLPFFSVPHVLSTITYIENKYLSNELLLPHFINNCPVQLQRALLNMIAAIHKATSTEEKLIAFHRSTALIDLIIPWLKNSNCLQVYFVRTISYVLVHLISNNNNDHLILNVAACRYFSTLLSQMLPENSEVFENFLVPFVSVLVSTARNDNDLGLECTRLLNRIIIDNEKNLTEAIRMLDPFPEEQKFLQMQYVYKRVKYPAGGCTLHDEIEYFLTTGELMHGTGYRTEGLKYLKNQLASKKEELKEIYNQLYSVRGFSEDCQKSVLHRLICVLVKLSLSSGLAESVEATRCLGELGPADLLTTVLQTEQKFEYEIQNRFELVTGCVTALLSTYIVDFDIRVIQVASETLYRVLDCKEGKIVLDSGIDYGYGTINKAYISPFVSTRQMKSDTNYGLKQNFKELVNSNLLWYPKEPTCHADWITKLVCTLLQTFTDKCYLSHLIPVCKVKVEFSEHLLPLLIYLILTSGYAQMVSGQIRRFFEQHWIHSLHSDNSEDISVNRLSVQCMLNVVHFIRVRKNVENKKKFETLSLNYLHVAQAAQFCTAHFTALLYLELWCQEQLKEIRDTQGLGPNTAGLTSLDIIMEHEEPQIRQRLQNIFKEAYKKVGELDALRTCEIIGLLDNNSLVKHYEHLQQWDQIMLLYNIHQISEENSPFIPKLVDTFKNSTTTNSSLNHENLLQSQYECAWRLSNWSLPQTNTDNSTHYEKYKYFALKALHDNHISNFNSAITNARKHITDSLRHASLESSKNLYEPLSQLQSLLELEDFAKAKAEGSFERLLEKWKIQCEINRNEFEYMEPIETQRIVMVKDLVVQEYDSLENSLVEMLLKLAVMARMEGKQTVANRALVNIVQIGTLTMEIKSKVMMEEAQMRWMDDKTIARYILRNLLNNPPTPRMRGAALKLCGTWMVETCSENPQTIIHDYFMESVNVLNSLEKTQDDCVNLYETYDVLARFTDLQYQQVLTYIKSSVFERKVENMEKSKLTADNITKPANRKPSVDEVKAKIMYERQSMIDKTEINNTLKEKNVYLMLAVKYYMRNLRNCDTYNVRLFRIFSLWLENRTNTDLVEFLRKYLLQIPSYKYIPILPQIIPHVTSTKDDTFGNQINAIVEQCGLDHPHHTLPIVMALANSNKDKSYYKSTTSTVSNEPRVTGAEALMEKFKKKQSFKQMINRMETLCKALIQLAYVSQDTCRMIAEKKFYIPSSCLVNKIKDFSDVLLPTHSLPVKKNCDYSNIIGKS